MAAQGLLVEAERKLFRAYWQDGLLDLVTGATIAAIGVSWMLGSMLPALGLPIIAVFVWQVSSRCVTEPRLGAVELSEQRVRGLRHGLIAILSLGLVVGGNLVARMLLSSSPTPFAQWYAPAVPSTIVAAMSLSCAVALGLWRFVAYAVAFGAAGLLVADAGGEPWAGMIAGGTVVAACGGVLLVRFLRRYPARTGDGER